MRVDLIKLEKVLKQMDQCQYETGAIIGCDSSGIITSFIFDHGRNHKDNVYTPNTVRLNRILVDLNSKGIKFCGIMHSHKSKNDLSYADIEYAELFLKSNQLKEVFMPVYVLEMKRVFWYKVGFSSISCYTITEEGIYSERSERTAR